MEKQLSDAKRAYLEQYGDALVTNTYLRLGLLSRRDDRDDRNNDGSGLPDGLSRAGSATRPRVPLETDSRSDFGDNRREVALVRTRAFHVRPSERAALDAVGRFRVVDASDLAAGIYPRNGDLARNDFQSLIRQKLIKPVSFRNREGELRRIFTLTPDGRAVAQSRSVGGQQLYQGFAKPAECEHDSRLYRAYLHEERQLIAQGASVKRVVLDYELKRGYFSRLNAQGNTGPYRQRQADAAGELHLPVINGHTVFPDVRIEYEDDRGDRGRIDVEVATGNYRGQHVTVKATAGFRVYAAGGTAGRLRVANGPLLGGHFHSEGRSALLLL